MDIKARIHEIFTQGAAQGGKLKSGAGSVDDAADVKYINEQVKAFESEEEAKVKDRGITDLKALSQTKAQIKASVNKEMQEMLGLDFANGLGIQKKIDVQKGAVFSDEDISLENLMSLLDDKVSEYDKKGNIVLDDDGNVVKSDVNKSSLEKNFAISEMTHAGVSFGLAKNIIDTDIDTHSLAVNMTSPKFDYPNSTKENCELYGNVSNIANLMDYLRENNML